MFDPNEPRSYVEIFTADEPPRLNGAYTYTYALWWLDYRECPEFPARTLAAIVEGDDEVRTLNKLFLVANDFKCQDFTRFYPHDEHL